MNGVSSQPNHRPSGRFLILLLLLGGAMTLICREGLLPHHVFWANDYALGAASASASRYPSIFAGVWGNFWWIGGAAPSSSPSLSNLLATVLSPALYLKVYAPLSMCFLGYGVWFFFRQLRFAPMVCVIAGLGAGLNMHFFSNSCWGLGTWSVSSGMVFISLGLLVSPYIRQLWIKAALVGLAIGMVVMEGFDVGAIYSVFIGLFILFYFLIADSNKATGLAKGVGVAIVAVIFAVFISASTLYTLVGTQLKGAANVGSSPQEQQGHWDFTTQWSLPKIESLRVIIPGLFGYRMADYMTTTNMESQYWGRVGEDPRIDRLQSTDPKTRAAAAAFLGGMLGLQQEYQDMLASTSPSEASARGNLIDQLKGYVQRRHTGSGDFTGVLVCLLAIFGVSASLRKGSPFATSERLIVGFWGLAALFSLMAAWGHFGFVYALIYHLPFFSNIRNPVKFLHSLNICLMLLSGFGLEALYRSYLQSVSAPTRPFLEHLSNWWKNVSGFDKRWAIGLIVALVLFGVGFLIMNSSVGDLAHYMEHNGFGEDWAPRMAAFSAHEVGLFLVFFGISAIVLIIIMSGAWSGKKMIWAWGLLSAIMICDLARADLPWVRYYDYKQKYSMNPVVDFLRHEPWEHRVVSRMSPMGGYDMGTDPNFGRLCHWWLENDYPYNDIQDLEVDQAPRMPVLDNSYMSSFNSPRVRDDLTPAAQEWLSTHGQQDPLAHWVLECGPASRLWRLTNTRYLFASSEMLDVLNRFVDPPNSFRAAMRLDLVNKPGIDIPEDAGDLTVLPTNNGSLALIEYTGALPRAKLFSNWHEMDDAQALQTLRSSSFDPYKTVLLATNTPVAQAPNAAAPDPGTVNITKYEPKDVVLTADAKTPAVLLLNDRTGDFWNAWVDGSPQPVLRCNYIMRGVYMPAGKHTIEFRFQAPLTMLYITIAALVTGVLLGSFVLYDHFQSSNQSMTPPAPEQGRPAAKSA